MKTFDEFTRKFFVQDEDFSGPGGSGAVQPGEAVIGDEANFVIPECWKPKTLFQYSLIKSVLPKTDLSIGYSIKLVNALEGCIADFEEQHTITKANVLFDENLNFTVTTEESESTAESDKFVLPGNPGEGVLYIEIDGTEIPGDPPSDQYTGMLARIVGDPSDIHKGTFVLTHVDADTFADGEHHVVFGFKFFSLDIEPKTYKELALDEPKLGAISPIMANKMLPKTPEELAFALFTRMPLKFSSDSGNELGGHGDLNEGPAGGNGAIETPG
jgi:hypothetical protein